LIGWSLNLMACPSVGDTATGDVSVTPNFASVTEAVSTEAAEVDGVVGAFFSHAAAAAKTTSTHKGRTNLDCIGFLQIGVGLVILCRLIAVA
jgi:hypothetical protein